MTTCSCPSVFKNGVPPEPSSNCRLHAKSAHKVVNVGAGKSLERFWYVTQYALATADILLSDSQHKSIIAAIKEIVLEEGFFVGKEISK